MIRPKQPPSIAHKLIDVLVNMTMCCIYLLILAVGLGKKVSTYHDFMSQYEMICKHIDAGGPGGKACSNITKEGFQKITTEMNAALV